jgi:hypothetical protein
MDMMTLESTERGLKRMAELFDSSEIMDDSGDVTKTMCGFFYCRM